MTKQRIICSVFLVVALGGSPSALGDEPTFKTIGGHPLIPARWTAGCGTDALYLCLALNGVKLEYADFVAKSGLVSSDEPIDMARLWQMARDCGAHAQGIRVRNGPEVLRKIMEEVSVRTAIVHLKAVERDGERKREHFSAVLVLNNKLRIVGEDSHEYEVAKQWETRWSGAALLVSDKPIGISGPEDAPRAQIRVTPAKFDCGQVYSGSKVPFQFMVENRGDGDLKIVEVTSDCSCSTPTVGETLIHPKQSTTMEGYVEAGSVLGRRAVKITMLGTDPERPKIQVDVVLDVVPLPIKLSESEVMMSTRSRTERPKSTVLIEYADPNAGIRVARLEPSAEWLTAELSPDASTIMLNAAPLSVGRSRSGTLMLYTANPEAVLKVPVEVRLVEPIECSPAELYLDRKKENADALKRTIELRPLPGIVLIDVKAEIRGVPGSVGPITFAADKGVWQVELEFGPFSSDAGMMVGALEISSSSEGDTNAVRVPVYVR